MNIQVIYSGRKSMAIQIKPDLTVVVRVPYGVPRRTVMEFVNREKAWIDENVRKMECANRERELVPRLTEEEIKVLKEQALKYIPERVEHFAPIVGVDYHRITIRNQKTRWGSCSAKGNLNFNCLLMQAPSEVIDYVVVHELCHRKYMNHSKAFWCEVEKVLPEYKTAKRWLRENARG